MEEEQFTKTEEDQMDDRMRSPMRRTTPAQDEEILGRCMAGADRKVRIIDWGVLKA